MIPSNRPVLGKDLDTVRQQYGMLVADACWLFGLSITRWTQIVRQKGELPVKDPTLALLVRYLDQHPDLSVIPKLPEAEEMFAMINAVQETGPKQFAVLFGSESSASYRWFTSGGRQSAAVNRLMYYLKLSLLTRQPGQRAELLQDWRKTVEQEAAARGSNNVFKTGKWNQKGVAEATEKLASEVPALAVPSSKKGVGKKTVKVKPKVAEKV